MFGCFIEELSSEVTGINVKERLSAVLILAGEDHRHVAVPYASEFMSAFRFTQKG